MPRKLLLALFFLSGISALIYEVCWVRQATLTSGVSIYAYSAVLTALQISLAVLGTATPFASSGLTALYAAGIQALTPSPAILTALRLLRLSL